MWSFDIINKNSIFVSYKFDFAMPVDEGWCWIVRVWDDFTKLNTTSWQLYHNSQFPAYVGQYVVSVT